MAIHHKDVPCDKTVTLSRSSLNHYKHGNSPAICLVKMDFAPESSISNLSYKQGKYKNNPELNRKKSPYLKNSNHPILGDRVQLLSRVTEKRFVHKNGGTIMSSLPLAGNMYKTNPNRKILKSVLTLPNNSAPAPQLCMNDMNDPDRYFDGKDDHRRKNKKRSPQAIRRKCPPQYKSRELESQYCSDMDFQLGCSSTDTIKKCGDGKKIYNSTAESKGKVKEKVKPHDVWAVLRNMNRFQFQTSPQISEDSFTMNRQKKKFKRRNNRQDMRVFETRRTEEFAYISSYKVDKSPSASRCSSFDKITVIDNNQSFKVSKEIEDKPKKKKTVKLLGLRPIKSSPKGKTPSAKRNNLKAITYINENKIDNVDNNENMCPNYGELKEQLNNNASVDLGYESKTTENDEDFISFDLNTTYNATQASQCSQSKLSDNSGSSKAAAFTKHITHKEVKLKTKVEPDKQIIGITKVLLSRGQNIDQTQQHNRIEPPKRKIRQEMVAPGPYCSLPPKLTKTEISRQLHKYKFPVVILGKDQIRSSIHVVNSEHPQFDGLDRQIWPFMQSWYGIERPVKVLKKQINHNLQNKKTKTDEIEKKAPSKNIMPKPTKIPDKIPKIEHKRAPLPLSDIINQTQNQKKLKPIRQLKDRMLKLLYKNSIVLGVIDGPPSSDTGKTVKNNTTVSVCTDNCINDKCDTNHLTIKVKKPIMQMSSEKRAWAKAKWASDFIENVIKKIKSGAYYNQDGINKVYYETPVIEKKEVDIQTDSNVDSIPKSSYANPDEFVQQIAIPGFDNCIPALEIKTMSINEVAVKHCGTNIMVHFDITIPTKSIADVKTETSFLPIDITKSLTRVFKCQTSILNAMLPAELCSILPKMLSDIVDSGKHLALIAPSSEMPRLTTLEVPIRSENLPNISAPKLALPTTLTLNPLALKLRQLLNKGYFKKDYDTTAKFHILKKTPCILNDAERLVEELRLHVKRIYLFDIESQLMKPLKVTCQNESKNLSITKIKPMEQINTCRALQPYPITNNGPISMSRTFSLMKLFETMATYINNIRLSCFRMIIKDNNLAINMNIGNCLSVPNVVTLRIGNLKTDSLKDCSKYWVSSKIKILPDSDKMLIDSSKSVERVKFSACNVKALESNYLKNNKARRKVYVKLYKKCKSSSGENTTPLNRIKTLDDFFLALGSAKLLSGVFDDQSRDKIMSSIDELKNWITEINPSQALLVILLANKKDTPSLLRYRPMLLQGIAVKRITKAIELDTEIEVIERENLYGVTRASDYQRPFDHTSEKLLKSLLGKRKQLNPSYLRVMARYVGLGLLKSPGRRQ